MKAARALALLLAAAALGGCSLWPFDWGKPPDVVEPEAPEVDDPPADDGPLGAQDFVYYPVGALAPNSGVGSPDLTVYAPEMVFPVREYASFLNSQVYGVGGARGPAGAGWCDQQNYVYPWRDNFCESRPGTNRPTLNCPSNAVHQGQDIRAGSSAVCNAQRELIREDPAGNRLVPVVAAEDGFISNIGTYTVTLRADNRIYRYLHLNMGSLAVEPQQEIAAGDLIGYLSNDFGGTPTTIHLHFELKQNVDGVGWTWVSPYMSLVRAYERYIGDAGEILSDDAVATASVPSLREDDGAAVAGGRN